MFDILRFVCITVSGILRFLCITVFDIGYFSVISQGGPSYALLLGNTP